MSQTINDLAKKALDEVDGDWAKAAKTLESWLENDKSLMDEMLKPFLSKAVWTVITACARATRKPYFTTTDVIELAQMSSDNTEGIEQVAKRAWFNYCLQGGLKLGEATYDDLQTAVETHQHLADTNAYKARWLARIASLVKGSGKDTVKESLTEELIGQIAHEEM